MKNSKLWIVTMLGGFAFLSIFGVSHTKAKSKTIYVEKNDRVLLTKKSIKKYKIKIKKKGIASVSKKGYLKGKKVGNTKIVLKKGKRKITYVVHVVKEIDLSRSEISMLEGMTQPLKFSIGNRKGKWKTTNSKIATVTKDGKITAKKEGTCKIVVNYLGKKYVCDVRVCKAQESGGYEIRQIHAIVNKIDMVDGKLIYTVTTLNNEIPKCTISISEAQISQVLRWNESANGFWQPYEPVKMEIGDELFIKTAVLTTEKNWGLDKEFCVWEPLRIGCIKK